MAYSNKFKSKTDALKDYKSLSAMIDNVSIPHCLLLYGEEAFLLDSLYRNILDFLSINDSLSAVDKHIFDCDNKVSGIDWDDLLQSISMPSLFGTDSAKVFIIKNSKIFVSSQSDNNADIIKKIIALLSDNDYNDKSYLIFIEDRIDARSKLFKFIKDRGLCFCMSKLSSHELEDWIKNKITEANFTVDPALVQYLIEACDADLFLIESELKKLFIVGKKNKWNRLTSEKCRKILRPNLTGDVFALVDAIAASNLKVVLEIYNNLIDRKESNQMILLMILRHFRELLCLIDSSSYSDNDIMTALGYSSNMSWKIKKLKSQTKNFTAGKLKYLIKMCADIDLNIKSNGCNENNEMIILLSLAVS